MQFNLQNCSVPSMQHYFVLSAEPNIVIYWILMLLAFTFRFIVPMQNGELDSKGLLATLVRSDGTVESFKV